MDVNKKKRSTPSRVEQFRTQVFTAPQRLSFPVDRLVSGSLPGDGLRIQPAALVQQSLVIQKGLQADAASHKPRT